MLEVTIDCDGVIGLIIVVSTNVLVEVRVICITVVVCVEDIPVDTIKKES
jgi:hypothetical protein